jgi:biotin transporter BioY
LKLSTVRIASIAVFAALQALLAVLPFTITIGVSGQITLGIIGGSLIGILLGPITGGLAVLVGSFVGVALNPGGALFGILTPIAPFLGAVGAGCVKIKKGYVAGALILASLLIFYANPSGREAIAYTWLHIVAMVVAFSPIAWVAGSAFDSARTAKPMFGIAVAAFVGVLTDHIAGSALAIWYFSPSPPPEIWFLAMPVYPVERIVAVVLTTLIAAPVYYTLRRAGLSDLISSI